MRPATLPAVLLLPVLLAFCKEQEVDDEQAARVAAAADGGTSTAPASPAPASAAEDEDVVAYAELCKRELGITAPLPAMSCLAGQEVPTTIDGQPVDASNYDKLQKGCDNPQWLMGACFTYDHIQRVDVGNPDVEAVLNCRQKYWTNHLHQPERRSAYEAAPAAEKAERYSELAEFDDLGLILRNKTTGKSCFFTTYGRKFNGAWLPGPDAKTLPPKSEIAAKMAAAGNTPPPGYADRAWYRDARATFYTPHDTAVSGGCVGCHDLGAFKHSPFVDQLTVVPPNRSKQIPYLLVGNVFREQFEKRQMVEVTTEPVDGAPQKCTMCHRLTSGGESCNQFLKWATGHDGSPLSQTASTWPRAAWMPMNHGATSPEEYQAKFGKHIDKMSCCCKTPNAKGCQTRAFGPTNDALGQLPPGQVLPPFQAAAADAAESCE